MAVLGAFVAAALGSGIAQASSLDDHGQLVFDSDALLTEGFESLSLAQSHGASWMTWNIHDGSSTALAGAAVTSKTWTTKLGSGTPGTVTLPNALEGGSALQLTSGKTVAFGLLDSTLFNAHATARLQISFWGLSVGAEPQLQVIYSAADNPDGPIGTANLVALRTGRETSDGWAEYSTGPIDGQIFDEKPISAVLLSARFATANGTYALDSIDLSPPISDTLQDSAAYALVDGLEIEPATGTPTPFVACTQATASATCGPLGECAFGQCVDGAAVWGVVPLAADHRSDLVSRWAFMAEHLIGDRQAAVTATTVFSPSAVASVAAATGAPAFYGTLNTMVSSLRDGHTALGYSPAEYTHFYEGMGAFNPDSSSLDLCFGLALDDLPGGTGQNVYAVFWMGPGSAVGSAYGGTLIPGDMLTQIDGMAPDAWLDAVGPRFRGILPNDPASEPTGRALILAQALAKYASSAQFSSCTSAGACTTKTIAVGDIAYARVTGSEYQGQSYAGASVSSRYCSGRFADAVSTWTAEDDDDSYYDVPLFESAAGLTSVEFDGFEGAYDDSSADPYHAWKAPFIQALGSGQNLLIDARQGHGGDYDLGTWLAHQIRGTSSPYFSFGAPRGDWDDPDPTWLFDPSLASCEDANDWAPFMCGWAGGQIDQATLTAPPVGTFKVAWLDGNDVSMNDVTPRDLLAGRGSVAALSDSFRIFGPHPTTGAYGEFSALPAIVPGWEPGGTQILDTRFATSFATAVAAPWGSGKGVPPDEVVVQKMSDFFAGSDTMLLAARAWLAQ